MTSSELIDPPLRRALKRAIAWRTLADIVRHHPHLGLRIVETHPCGGTYECLTLVTSTLDPLCSFNLPGTGLSLGKRIGPRRDGRSWGDSPDDDIWRYPQHGLGEDRSSLAKDIEAWLGFPARECAPETTVTGLTVGVVAELLERVAFGVRPLELRCGWEDDAWAVGVRPWALALPAVAAWPVDAPWQDRCRAAARYWAIDASFESGDPAVIVDVATSAVWHRGRRQPTLAEQYGSGAGIRALAWSLEQALDDAT